MTLNDALVMQRRGIGIASEKMEQSNLLELEMVFYSGGHHNLHKFLALYNLYYLFLYTTRVSKRQELEGAHVSKASKDDLKGGSDTIGISVRNHRQWRKSHSRKTFWSPFL